MSLSATWKGLIFLSSSRVYQLCSLRGQPIPSTLYGITGGGQQFHPSFVDHVHCLSFSHRLSLPVRLVY